MKRLAIAVLLFFICQLLLAPAHTSASGFNWNPGYWIGKVEFRADLGHEEHETDGDAYISEATTLIYESSGQILCIVSDFAGDGTCTGRFPTQKHEKTLDILSSPNCKITYEEREDWPAVIGLVSIPPAVSKTLSTGFSIPFTPQIGPEEGSAKTSFNGSDSNCGKLSKAFIKTDISIPEWPNLDFKITVGSEVAVGGTCNMQTFPRGNTAPYSFNVARISKCEWSMRWSDPTAKSP